MTPRARLETRIAPDLKRHLEARAQREQVALTALVEAALRQLLTPETPPEPSVADQLRRVRRDLRALHQEIEILEETLGLFINVYLSMTPEVPPEQEEAARQQGGRRYSRFMKILEGKLGRQGPRRPHEGAQDDRDSTPTAAGPGTGA